MRLTDLLHQPGVLPSDEGDRRVLVVDDDLAVRTATARVLRKAGYACLTATSTAEARELLGVQAFGVVVTDVRMWSEDGLELVRHVADEYPATYCIVITGLPDESLEQRVPQAGGYALLRKPFDRADLLENVEDAFAERSEKLALLRHRSM